jgi:hypothetical protein
LATVPEEAEITEDAGGDTVIAAVSDPALLGVYPTLDEAVSFSDTTDLALLDGHARRRLTRGKAPIVLPSIEVDPSAEPVIGSYTVGDIVKVRGGYG